MKLEEDKKGKLKVQSSKLDEKKEAPIESTNKQQRDFSASVEMTKDENNKIIKITEQSNNQKKNKNRPRNKKRNIPTPIPERKDTQINNLDKNKPAKFIKQNNNQPKTENNISKGEINFDDLMEGGIEINLD